jgi:hypothetical protein
MVVDWWPHEPVGRSAGIPSSRWSPRSSASEGSSTPDVMVSDMAEVAGELCLIGWGVIAASVLDRVLTD